MIDAEMYGITLRAKMAMRSTAPPENVFHIPRMPCFMPAKASAYWAVSRPGIGICAPMR